MNSKEVKQSLKEAKEAIKNKEVEKAIKLCKTILKTDRNNYLALVIFGAALQEADCQSDAVKAYKKAIDLSPDQILAWQGLASYFEKEKLKNYNDLLLVYQQLILLEKDVNRKKDIYDKVTLLVNSVETPCVNMLASFLDDKDLQSNVADFMLQHYTSMKSVPENELNSFRKALIIKTSDSSDTIEYVEKYLNALSDSKRYKQFLEDYRILNIFDARSTDLLELYCKIYSLSHITDSELVFENIDECCENLLRKKNNSYFGSIAKAVILFNNEDYVSCRNILIDVSDRKNDHWLVHWYLSKVYLIFHCFEDAVSSLSLTRRCLPCAEDKKIENLINTSIIEASSHSESIDNCISCLERCVEELLRDPSNGFYLKCYIRVCISLQKWHLAEEKLTKLKEVIVEDPEIKCLEALFLFKTTSSAETAINLLRSNICEEIQYLNNWLLLGELFWDQKNYSEAVDCFFKAAKLAPYVYLPFSYLGHYYRDVVKDLQKARRCYQKAFSLNKNSDDIAEALSNVYRQLDFKENNFNLLNEIATMSRKKWALLRLGIHYLDTGDAKSAVNCLQSAVRSNNDDSYCWELMGEAYFARGAYTAALKSYQKCLDLDSSSLYAAIQLATIKQRIGLHDESIAEFREIVRNNPNYVPALKGLAETCLIEARNLFDGQMLGCSRDLCQEAGNSLKNALKQNSTIACIWKLFGDTCVLVSRMPSSFSYLSLPAFLFEKNLNIETDYNQLVRTDQLLNFSLKCYLAAVHLSGENENLLGFLWHDIAFCYNLQAIHANDNDKFAFRKNAFAAIKRSISMDEKNWEHWNLMGVIAVSDGINDPGMAQHCFIKAIKLESSSAIPWSNLGILYLKHDHVQLANEAFQKAQSIDPKYPQSWIGQAIIAEYVNHEETADLFYHCVSLGYHQESSKGFAEWVCKILKNWDQYKDNYHCSYLIQKMFPVPLAATCLNWYTIHEPDDVCATNTLSILYELCNLYRTAILASKNSLKLVSNEYADIVRSNLGRQLRKKGDYNDAIKVYQQVKEVDFSIQCDLALSTFLAGKLDEALMLYESAIHWLAPNDGCVAQVMVATAALNYLTNKKDEAQTLLFQCIQLKPVPVYGLFAACAFGILNRQLKLSKLVLEELEAFKQQREHIPHIAFFHAYCEVIQGNFQSAVRAISKFVFGHPGDATLWLYMCLLLLNLINSGRAEYNSCAAATAQHARYAITLGRGKIDISKISSIMSLSYLLAGNVEQSLRCSSKSIFLYPNVAENWAVLIAVQFSLGNDYLALRKTIQFVRQNLSCTEALAAWFKKVEQKITAIVK